MQYQCLKERFKIFSWDATFICCWRSEEESLEANFLCNVGRFELQNTNKKHCTDDRFWAFKSSACSKQDRQFQVVIVKSFFLFFLISTKVNEKQDQAWITFLSLSNMPFGNSKREIKCSTLYNWESLSSYNAKIEATISYRCVLRYKTYATAIVLSMQNLGSAK